MEQGEFAARRAACSVAPGGAGVTLAAVLIRFALRRGWFGVAVAYWL
jgi:hypothetical protein